MTPSTYFSDKFTAGDRTPYTYLIGWSELNTWYYGAKYGKKCHPSELFNFRIKRPYLTSSKHVENFRKEHGEPNVIQIRKIFSDPLDARLWEDKVLRRMDAVSDARFLNKRNGSSKKFNTDGYTCANIDGIATLISVNDPRYVSGEIKHFAKDKINVIDEDNNVFQVSRNDPEYISGKLVTYHSKFICVRDPKSNNTFMTERTNPDYISGKLLPALKGLKRSEETKDKISAAIKGTVTAIDEQGNTFRTTTDHPKYISGEWRFS